MWAAVFRNSDRSGRGSFAVGTLAIAVVYLLLGEMELRLFQLGVVSSLIWAPSGLGVALILLYGLRWIPGVAIGTFAAIVLHGNVWVATVATVVETLELAGTYVVLRSLLGFRPQLDRVRDVTAFVAVGILISLTGAGIGSAVLLTTHFEQQQYVMLWSSWWKLDLSGDLIVAPAVLTWLSRSAVPQRPRAAEVVALAASGLLVALMVFASWLPSWLPAANAPYYLLPILLWAGVRFGPRGAATASLVASLLALVVDSLEIGTFPERADLQAFIAISSITTLVLSALVQERVRAVARRGAIQLGALDGIITVDRDGRVLELNPAAEQLFAVRAADTIGRDLATLIIPPRLRGAYYRGFQHYVTSGKSSLVGSRYRTTAWRPDGSEFPVEIAITRPPQDDELVITGFIRDASAELAAETARREAREDLERKVEERTAELRESLRENDTRMREIHHRVKNNLQVISSLLNLQLSSADSESARRLLLDSQNRIAAMALVHQLLYQSNKLARIDFGDYLRRLVERLVAAQNVAPERVATLVEATPVEVDIDRAISCGLIVNELVTNALAHAFPDGRRGCITISLEQQAKRVALTVADDGIGLPGEFRVEGARSFGLKIVHTLVHQLDGTIERLPVEGTALRVTFPLAGRGQPET